MKNVEVEKELEALFDYCAIYCSPNCCGLASFEIHKGLLLRYLLDRNSNLVALYNAMNSQITKIYESLCNLVVSSEEVEIGVVYLSKGTSPNFSLPYNEAVHFFRRWQRVFRQVKGTNAVP